MDEVAVFSKALRPSVTFKGNIMNKSSLLFSTLLGVATITAQAGELYMPEQYQAPAASALSRAQVKQSVLQARASGGHRRTT